MQLSRWEIKERLGHGALSRIADRCGVSVSLVSAVLHGKRRNATVERAIARAIGRAADETFPPRETAAA